LFRKRGGKKKKLFPFEDINFAEPFLSKQTGAKPVDELKTRTSDSRWQAL